MLRIHDRSKNNFCPWTNDSIPDYDKFLHSKHTNFDYDEHFYVSPTIHGCNLTTEITKSKGEKVTEKDLNAAFANSLCVVMADFDVDEEDAQNYFLVLPPEFYTKETHDLVCETMAKFKDAAPKFERPNLERNLHCFQVFANKLNPEEIPTPQPPQNDQNFSK